MFYIYIYQLRKNKEYNNAINGVPNSIALDLTSKIKSTIKTESMTFYDLSFMLTFNQQPRDKIYIN